jgi:hypothetical protein
MTVQWWNYVEMRGNTIYTTMTTVSLKMKAGASTRPYSWDNNTYINGRPTPVFKFNSMSGLSLSTWQQTTRLDQNSHINFNKSLRPRGVEIFLRPNKYEVGRAHITVFNWELQNTVTVDLANLGLNVGDSYEVRDAQNYFGPPLMRSTYNGKPIQLPMRLSHVASPVGNVERRPAHTAPEFAVFIVQKSQNPTRQS